MNRRDFLSTAALAAASSIGHAAESPRIRVAQIGTAHSHAAGKMEAVRGLPELYEVKGFVERDAARLGVVRKGKAFDGLPVLSVDEILADASVQAVLVESTLEESANEAITAIRAGKHVHLDKPGAADHRLFREMRLEAEKRGLILQMGYMLRYNPAFELLFRAAREGWLGEVTEVHASMGKLAGPGQIAVLKKFPGGGMFELGCHLVDAVVTLLGKPSDVYAFGKSIQPDGFKDNQVAVLEYPKATVTLRCNHADPFGGEHRFIHVVGTKGSVAIAPLESGRVTLRLSTAVDEFAKGENILSLKVPAGRYRGEFMDFATAIRGEKKFRWNAEHDITVHRTALRSAGVI